MHWCNFNEQENQLPPHICAYRTTLYWTSVLCHTESVVETGLTVNLIIKYFFFSLSSACTRYNQIKFYLQFLRNILLSLEILFFALIRSLRIKLCWGFFFRIWIFELFTFHIVCAVYPFYPFNSAINNNLKMNCVYTLIVLSTYTAFYPLARTRFVSVCAVNAMLITRFVIAKSNQKIFNRSNKIYRISLIGNNQHGMLNISILGNVFPFYRWNIPFQFILFENTTNNVR